MGNYVVHKGLLLDEKDLDLPPTADMACIATAVCDYAREQFGTEDDWPGLEIFGVASERLGTVEMIDDWSRTMWITASTTFVDIVRKEAARLDLPRVDASWHSAEIADPMYRRRAHQDICDLVHAGAYYQAENLLTQLAWLRDVGLPGFRPGPCFSRDLGDELVDYRDRNHGPGRRVFAELGFNWGQ